MKNEGNKIMREKKVESNTNEDVGRKVDIYVNEDNSKAENSVKNKDSNKKLDGKNTSTYIWLLGINMFISAFTFGGGYVVVPMIRKYFITKKNLFSEDELMNMAAIAQSTPGAIAINLSALAGYRVAGILGVVISCIAAVLPPLIILAFVSTWYANFAANTLIAAVLKGMQAGVAALIVDLVIDMTSMIIKKRTLLLTLMIPMAFMASFIFNINVAIILVGCCGLCMIRVWYNGKRRLT